MNGNAKEKRLAHKNIVTTRLSETARFVGFGMIAWVFAIQSGTSKLLIDYNQEYQVWIGIVGLLAIASIVFDYLQYLSAYISVLYALKRDDANYKFDSTYWAYKLQNSCFIFKQVSVVTSSVLAISTFLMHLLLS